MKRHGQYYMPQTFGFSLLSEYNPLICKQMFHCMHSSLRSSNICIEDWKVTLLDEEKQNFTAWCDTMDLPAFSDLVPSWDCAETLGSAVLEYRACMKSKQYPSIEEMEKSLQE